MRAFTHFIRTYKTWNFVPGTKDKKINLLSIAGHFLISVIHFQPRRFSWPNWQPIPTLPKFYLIILSIFTKQDRILSCESLRLSLKAKKTIHSHGICSHNEHYSEGS